MNLLIISIALFSVYRDVYGYRWASNSKSVIKNVLRKRLEQKMAEEQERERVWTFAVGTDRKPVEFADPEVGVVGINLQVAEEICIAAGRNCEFVALPYTACMTSDSKGNNVPGEALLSRQIDGCLGWGINRERSNSVRFSEAYFGKRTHRFFVKQGNPYNFNPDDIKGKTIGLIHGLGSADCLRQAFSLGVADFYVETFPSLFEATTYLNMSKIDALFYSAAGLEPELRFGFQQLEVNGCNIICENGFGMMTRKDNVELVQWFNEGIAAIRTDTCGRIPYVATGNCDFDVDEDDDGDVVCRTTTSGTRCIRRKVGCVVISMEEYNSMNEMVDLCPNGQDGRDERVDDNQCKDRFTQ